MGVVDKSRAPAVSEPIHSRASTKSDAVRRGVRLLLRCDHALVRRQLAEAWPRRIDILYVHDIGAMQHGRERHPAIMRRLRDGGYRALEELRRCGVVRAIGIGVNEREVLLEAMEWGAWDAFLLAGRYTLLEQAPLDDLLPKCLSSGISIVVGGPLNSGILAGRDTWNYKAAPPEIVE